MTAKNIDELVYQNYSMALMNIARIVNRHLGKNLTRRCSSTDDWMELEELAWDLGVQFTEDGKVIERRES